jgi:hypothetical protein
MLLGLRCWSCSPFANSTPRMNWPAGLGRAWHGLVGGDDPLNSLDEGRQLARLNETKELLAGDSGAHPVGVLDRQPTKGSTRGG